MGRNWKKQGYGTGRSKDMELEEARIGTERSKDMELKKARVGT